MFINESVKVWKQANIVMIHHTLLENGLDMTTEVEINQDHVSWVHESLAVFAENWQTQEQRHQFLDEKIEIFSAGNEMDPRVGIQNERGGKSFSIIVRLPLIKILMKLLSQEIPELPSQPSKPAQSDKPLKPSYQEILHVRIPDIKINRIECLDPLGDPAETIEISCGEASYWDWTPETLLAKLTRLQTRLSLENAEARKTTLVQEDHLYLLPGETAVEKAQVLTSMISQLEHFMGIKRKKKR